MCNEHQACACEGNGGGCQHHGDHHHDHAHVHPPEPHPEHHHAHPHEQPDEPGEHGKPHRCHHVDLIQKLHKERDEYLSGWQRSQADYQNLKKDVERQRKEFMMFANEGMLQELLPIVDFFKFAYEHAPAKEIQTSDWYRGIQHIRDEFTKVLERHGVKQIRTKGSAFDPQLHEAVEEIASDEPSGAILEELATGFTLHGKLLRPAKVKIAK